MDIIKKFFSKIAEVFRKIFKKDQVIPVSEQIEMPETRVNADENQTRSPERTVTEMPNISPQNLKSRRRNPLSRINEQTPESQNNQPENSEPSTSTSPLSASQPENLHDNTIGRS
jgi:hypothetical protein